MSALHIVGHRSFGCVTLLLLTLAGASRAEAHRTPPLGGSDALRRIANGASPDALRSSCPSTSTYIRSADSGSRSRRNSTVAARPPGRRAIGPDQGTHGVLH